VVDVVSSEVRSRMMAGIKGKNSRPELRVLQLLFAARNRFRLHRRDLPGSPDIVMPGKMVAIFVHGCFWHMHQDCLHAKLPTTRPDFWKAKLRGSVKRGRLVIEELNALGWRVLCVWECATRQVNADSRLQNAMRLWIEGDSRFSEVSGALRS
jgi:DNA mismatch endonuclease (patch repair protein)